MNKPRDRLDFFLPTNKFHVFLVCFVVPLLAVWVIFGSLAVVVVATNDGEARGHLHPLVSNPYLSGLLYSFEFALFAGFNIWFGLLIRHMKVLFWSYVLLVFLGFLFHTLSQSDDWLGAGFAYFRCFMIFAVLSACMLLFHNFVNRVTRLPRVPKPSVDNLLADDESVLMKSVARDERGASGWIFVTTTRVLFVASSAPNPWVSVPLHSIVLAKPEWTNNGPDQITVDTSSGSYTFDVDEGWDLLTLINERKDFSASRI